MRAVIDTNVLLSGLLWHGAQLSGLARSAALTARRRDGDAVRADDLAAAQARRAITAGSVTLAILLASV